MAACEQILVVRRSVVEQAGMFHGLVFDVQRYLDAIFAPGVPHFMPRPEAEANPSFKQIIPYVIISCGDRYLSYVRGKRAGETRLVAKRSIGIGGHINPADDIPLFDDYYKAYLAAVQREVAEEINIETGRSDRVIALLNDDSNEVGKVHLGIVHHWVLSEPKVSKREQMIAQMSFMTLKQLQQVKEAMETWSALCLEYLVRAAEAS